MWDAFEVEGETQYRAILEGYLVFLRREAPTDRFASRRKAKRTRTTGEWFVHFLIPDDERQNAYLAGEGFTSGTTLETAQRLALEKARVMRGQLERSASKPPRKPKKP
jgi:hypothetical protein